MIMKLILGIGEVCYKCLKMLQPLLVFTIFLLLRESSHLVDKIAIGFGIFMIMFGGFYGFIEYGPRTWKKFQ